MGMPHGGSGLGSVLDDVTRDAYLHDLGDHYAAGRLTADELDSRIQAALAAETEQDLAAVMTDLRDEPQELDSSPAPADDGSRRPWAQIASGAVALATGSALLAAVGPGWNPAEFAAGLAVGGLGFLTHWWMTRSSSTDGCACADRPADTCSDALTWHEMPDHGDAAAGEVVVIEPRVDPTRRPVGRGSGIIPTQRAGD